MPDLSWTATRRMDPLTPEMQVTLCSGGRVVVMKSFHKTLLPVPEGSISFTPESSLSVVSDIIETFLGESGFVLEYYTSICQGFGHPLKLLVMEFKREFKEGISVWGAKEPL